MSAVIKDSTNITILNKSFDRLVEDMTKSKEHPMFDVLIPLLIGAALTFLAQWFIEIFKSIRSKKQKRRELVSKGKAKTYLISQILRELAMYKVHKQYYRIATTLTSIPSEIDDLYSKHYQKGQEQRETEIKLSENVAQYIEMITEYQILYRKQRNFTPEIQKLYDFQHPKVKFRTVGNNEELEEMAANVEKELNSEYDSLRKILSAIQRIMEK